MGRWGNRTPDLAHPKADDDDDDDAAAAGDNNPTTDEDRVEVLMEYAPNAPPKRSSFPYRGLISINEVGVKNIDYVSTPIPGDTMQQHSSFGHTLLTKCAGLYNSVSLENVMRLLAAGANPSVKIKKSTPIGVLYKKDINVYLVNQICKCIINITVRLLC